MKIFTFILSFLLLAFSGVPVRAAETPADLLRKGLFEEEANQNLDAAIKAYQAIVDQLDEQRKIAATAVFRLAESYRKLGRTNEAAAQYERVLRDYSDQAPLVTLSRSYLATIRPLAELSKEGRSAASVLSDPAQAKLLEEEIKLVETQINAAQRQYQNGKATREDLIKLQRDLLSLRRKLPANAATGAQAEYITAEIKSVEELLGFVGKRIEVGQAAPLDEVPLKRELLALQRELAAVRSGAIPNATADTSTATAQLAAQLVSIEGLKADRAEQGRAVYAIFPDEDLKRMLLNLAGLREQEATLRANPNAKLTSWHHATDPVGMAALDVNSGPPDLGPPDLPTAQKEYQKQLSLIGERVDFILGVQKARLRVLQTVSGQAPSGLTTSDATQKGSNLSDKEEQEIQKISVMLRDSPDLVNAESGGRTPLSNAAYNGHAKLAKFLLEHGAEVDRASGGYTPLHTAALHGHKAVVDVLLANGANVNATDGLGNTPLHFAAKEGFRAVVEALLARGADPNLLSLGPGGSGSPQEGGLDIGGVRYESAGTPLHYAARRGHKSVVDLLLAKGAPADAKDRNDVTPLQAATIGQQLPIAELLLKQKVNVNQLNRYDQTALHIAAGLNNLKLVEILLANGADPNVTGARSSPLRLAVDSSAIDIVRALLRHRADVNAGDAAGFVPLHAAVGHNVELVSLLLEAGADPNLAAPDGRPALFNAVSSPKMVQLLLAHGARVNVLDNFNNTPLNFANARSNPTQQNWERDRALQESAKLLRAAGADEDFKYSSAITLGRKEGNIRIPYFHKGTNALNRFTLFEALAYHYVPRSGPVNVSYGQSNMDLPFPDFSRVTLRKAIAGATNEMLNLQEAMDGGDCAKDRVLDWGDVIEVPEANHAVNEGWRGITGIQLNSFFKCLNRHINAIIRGQATPIMLVPHGAIATGSSGVPLPRPSLPLPGAVTSSRLTQSSFGQRSPPGIGRTAAGELMIASFWATEIIQASGLLRSSSDLTRTKLTRTDPKTKTTQETVVNLEAVEPASANDLWLRDGDVIEIPDKE